LWKQFKLVHIDVSIDDIGDRFEYQRNGASWSEVVGNIRRFNQERRSNFKTQVTTSVNIMNVFYLPELYEWYKSENFDSWWINIVWTPAYSITNMPESAKRLVIARLKDYDFDQDQSQIDVIISTLENNTTVTNTNFINNIQQIDKIRNQDLRLAHKEIANAMGYVLN
jgi:hypothetical protein